MYCPKCGQPQATDRTRFCSRCGVNLDRVANLIAGDSGDTFERDEPLTKRLLAVALYVVVAILAVTGWGPWSGPGGTRVRALAVILSVLTFVLLFSRPLRQMIHMLSPRKAGRDESSQPTEQIRSAAAAPALPPAESVPVSGLDRQRVNTAEMVPRHSVTEHTTALLEEK